jgi:hypothetical protein
MEDSAQQRKQRQFLDAVEHSVHDINHEVIHAILPRMDKTTFMKMARSVAQIRIKYIAATAAALASGEAPSPQQAAQLKQLREQFEESRTGFDALKRAISRGYIDVGD